MMNDQSLGPSYIQMISGDDSLRHNFLLRFDRWQLIEMLDVGMSYDPGESGDTYLYSLDSGYKFSP